MDRETLEARIEKKLADIEKITRRVQKWNKGLTAEEEQIAWGTYREIRDYCKEHNFGWEKENQITEYYRACSDLKDANMTLTKYRNALAVLKEKADTPKIQAIMNFLESWKQDAADYVRRNVEWVEKYYELNHKYCDLWNHKFHYKTEMGEEEFKRVLKETDMLQKQAAQMIHAWTNQVYSRKAENHINEAALAEILDKEVEAKYWALVEKVTKIVGEITDAKGLEVAQDGNLNGVIIGTEGKAKVQTIYAGGYNMNRIVNVKHGQILHFRVLVDKIK